MVERLIKVSSENIHDLNIMENVIDLVLTRLNLVSINYDEFEIRYLGNFDLFINSVLRYHSKIFINTISASDLEIDYYINFVVESIFEIFYLYLFNKNYNIDKNKLFVISKRQMKYGRYNIIYFISKINFLENSIYEQFCSNLSSHFKIDQKDPACPFFKSLEKKQLFETIWSFIDREFFPELQEKFKPEILQYIESAKKEEESGLIALFHLGLLGKFQRGELTNL